MCDMVVERSPPKNLEPCRVCRIEILSFLYLILSSSASPLSFCVDSHIWLLYSAVGVAGRRGSICTRTTRHTGGSGFAF